MGILIPNTKMQSEFLTTKYDVSNKTNKEIWNTVFVTANEKYEGKLLLKAN